MMQSNYSKTMLEIKNKIKTNYIKLMPIICQDIAMHLIMVHKKIKKKDLNIFN